MDTTTDLSEVAENLGVRMDYDTHGLLKDGDLGGWFPDQRLILVRPDLGWRNLRHTVAHELGHAAHNHPANHDPKHERQADEYAARLLIDERDYVQAEIVYDGNQQAIAHELGVTMHLLDVWRGLYVRKTA